MTEAIREDAFEAGGADPADLFFNRMQDADTLSENENEDENHDDHDAGTDEDADADEGADEATQDDEDADESESDETVETKAEKAPVEITDDAVLKHKVDGVEMTFTGRDLKILAGRNAVIQRKEQEVADLRKRAEEIGGVATATLKHLREQALERFKPFEGTNLLLMSKHLSADELAIVTEQAQKAKAELDYFDNELENVSKRNQEDEATRKRAEDAQLKESAEASWKQLSDPNTGIPGWGMQMYNDLLGYAIGDRGLNREMVLTLHDPVAWQMIHDSYTLRKGKKVLEQKAKPVAKTGQTKIIKSSGTVASEMAKPSNDAKLMNRLRQTGDVDTAADLFLARATRK
ncbi:hypothetical protein ACFZ8E_07525 [Methylobacterium sp. HMF5984]|uniref:hypothetical protein n=1 Tax=Methylobacterium sp. HMF5984 TaxID=3367370 RepID=UPI0038555FB9